MAERPSRILVVDDTPQNLALIRAQLEREGYLVDTAAGGQAGLDAVAVAPPDLILLDVMMPDLDGYEVCRRLKASETTRAIPVVVLTALHDRADKLRAFSEGADDFLSKPVDRAELVARVRSHVRLKSLYDELARGRDEIARQARQIAVEKRHAERETATLTAVLAGMGDGLVVVDAPGTVRFCNAPAADLVGAAASDLLGASTTALFDRLAVRAEDPEVARAGWDAAIRDPAAGTTFALTITQPRRRDLVVGVFPVVDADGGSLGCGVLLRDVTREREMDRLKDDLVAVVSHELRTPLVSLVGFAELMLARDFADDERREFLGIILQEGQRLTALINDFLDLQRLESGRQRIKPVPTELSALLARAVAAAGEDLARPIRLDAPVDLPLINADADRVQQVLANVLSNARKYSPGGGAIELGARARGGAIEIWVADHGLGIPPEAIGRLFDKFYRVDSSDRQGIAGTGLGLPICQQIVAAHGGRIWAESPGPGRGSTFRFTLPVAAEPQDDSQSSAPLLAGRAV